MSPAFAIPLFLSLGVDTSAVAVGLGLSGLYSFSRSGWSSETGRRLRCRATFGPIVVRIAPGEQFAERAEVFSGVVLTLFGCVLLGRALMSG